MVTIIKDLNNNKIMVTQFFSETLNFVFKWQQVSETLKLTKIAIIKYPWHKHYQLSEILSNNDSN